MAKIDCARKLGVGRKASNGKTSPRADNDASDILQRQENEEENKDCERKIVKIKL